MEEIKNIVQLLIKEKSWQELKRELLHLEPFHIAELISVIDRREQIIIFRLLGHKQAKNVFKYLGIKEQEDIINSLADNVKLLTGLLNDLDPDDRTALFEELPGEVSQKLIQLLSNKERNIANQLLGYPKDSVGRLMTTDFVAVKPNFTVEEALQHIRKFGQDSETLDVIYIVDDNWKLVSDLRIKELLLANPDIPMHSLAKHHAISLSVFDDQEHAAQSFAKYGRTALPVTDSAGILLGIITVDDVFDVQERENTEDFQKFGGIEGLDLSYKKTSLLKLVKKRAGWLVILFFSEMLTASAMGYYDNEISKAVVLALFVPLIISSGGNSGSQAASLIIRSLALGDLKLKSWWYVMRKEILSGLMLGAILGAIGFIRILVWQFTGFYDYGPYWVWVGISVAFSLVFIVLWGTLSGSMIPFVLKRIGLDPATASAPFVATLVDVTGLVIYFSVAAVFLTGKLL